MELSPLDAVDLIKRYEGGETLASLAADCGVAPLTVRRQLAKSGVTIRTTAWGREQRARKYAALRDGIKDEVIRRYMAGESVKSLADAFGVATGTKGRIERILADAGVPIRGVSEAGALTRARHTEDYGRWLRPMHLSRPGQKEAEVFDWLNALELTPSRQAVCGRYNIDIAIGDLAVEVHDLGVNPLAAFCERVWRLTSRLEYLLDSGWHVLYVWITDGCPAVESAVTNEVVAFLDQARCDPAAPRQYRVIRGCGHLVVSGTDAHEFTGIKAPTHRHRRSG